MQVKLSIVTQYIDTNKKEPASTPTAETARTDTAVVCARFLRFYGNLNKITITKR